jgi:hypothetical protein
MKKTPSLPGLLCAAVTLSSSAFLSVHGHAEDAFFDALSGGKTTGNFRLRYENVDIDSASVKDATALTLRSRLGYETAPLEGFTAMAEFEDTRIIGAQDEFAPARAGYAAIVDPEQTELNQGFIRYRGVPKLDVSLGRQRITQDNQRYIGNVGWRQNEQTYDAFAMNYKGIADWNFYYAYINQVQGIASIKPTLNFSFDSDDHLVNIAYSGFVLGKITAYSYMLNNQQNDLNQLNPALRFQNNDTLGLRFDGVYVLPTTLPLRLLYTLEAAQQTLTTPTFIERDTDYSLFDIGMAYGSKIGGISFKLAQETMGSDKGLQGFQTPYATKHAFNGWSDMFLNTPTSGLVRQFATLGMDLMPYGVKVLMNYGTYSQDEGNKDFGDEFNAQVLKQYGAKYTLGIKYAAYSADKALPTIIGTNANIDTTKYWLWGEVNF